MVVSCESVSSLLMLLFQGKGGLAARRMFELMTEGPPIVAVLGPTLSNEMTVVGQITPFYDVLQVNYLQQMAVSVSVDFYPANIEHQNTVASTSKRHN